MRLLRRTTKKEKKLKYLVIGLTVSIIVYYIYGSSKTIQNESNMKYILLWAPANRNELFKYIDQGQETFKMRKCPKSNCYLSDNKMLLNNVTKYDVIVFHGPDIFGNYNVLPPRRAPHQKYIFASRTSSEYCEAPDDNKFDGYFNWTWTYKINSDIPMGYITIRDSKGNVIGPRKEMHWLKMEEMSPVNDDVLDILNRKSVAVAWIASNCHTLSERELYVSRLNDELSKYDLELDIYGRCGKMLCPKFLMDHCLYAIQLDYYFYLAFENSFDDDYVTESLLHGLQNFAVPIVYGGANYTRFMPDGIYIDATKMTPNALAQEIRDIIDDEERYINFFRWQNHYSYHYPEDSYDSDPLCILCKAINNEIIMKKNTVIDQFEPWWSMNDTLLK